MEIGIDVQITTLHPLFLNNFDCNDIDRIWWSVADQFTSIDIEEFTTVGTLNLTTIDALQRITANWTFSLDDTTAQPPKEAQKSDNGGNNHQSDRDRGGFYQPA